MQIPKLSAKGEEKDLARSLNFAERCLLEE